MMTPNNSMQPTRKTACGICGAEHDLRDLEPSYRLPDVIHALPEAIRAERSKRTRNLCALWGVEGESHRWFVRVLVPFLVAGRQSACSWGVWVELSQTAFDEIRELWDDPEQVDHGPWPATLANDAATYPSTIGLRGTIRFVDTQQIPHFAPDIDQAHRFVDEWRTGVSVERMTEWQLSFAHTV